MKLFTKRTVARLQNRLFCGAFFAFAGCGGPTTRSSYLETEGFYLSYEARSLNDGPPSIHAELRVENSGGTPLELTGGDSVRCNGVALSPEAPGNYGASMPTATGFVCVLKRDDEIDVERSLMPPSPLRAQFEQSVLSYGEPLIVRWNQIAGAQVTVKMQSTVGPCPSKTIIDGAPDLGVAQIDTQPFQNSGDRAAVCSFELSVKRTVMQSIGRPFASGSIKSTAMAQTSVTLQ